MLRFVYSHHDKGIEFDPLSLNPNEGGRLYVHMCSGHIQVFHLCHEKSPMVPQSIQLVSDTL